MTNEIIILDERVKLMEEGKLKGTGEFITVEINGEKKNLNCPKKFILLMVGKSADIQSRKANIAQ